MKFEIPSLLWLLALMPLLIWFYVAAWRRRQRLIAEFIPRRLVADLTVGVSRGRQKAKMILTSTAVALIIVAAARPQWGFQWDEATQKGLDIIVAIDASRSMLATDVVPNRLERAKLAALDLMKLAKTDRIGLIAFAGSAFMQCPLTLDDNAFRQSVASLKPEIMPQGGTALAETIQVALDAFAGEEENHKVLVLFTDGEDHQEQVLETAQKAAEEDLRIFTVGVGSPEGDLIPIGKQGAQTIYLKDQSGEVVKSRLNEALLQQVAGTAKGFYLNLAGTASIETLYTQGLAPLPKAEVTSRLVRRYFERFYWPLSVAIVLLLIEMFLPDKRRSRRSGKTVINPVTATLAFLLFGVGAASATPGAAMKAFRKGDFGKALEMYERLQEKTPKDHRLLYNAGASAYRAGEFDKALEKFSAAIATEDETMQEKVWYNLGNTQFRIGQGNEDPQMKLESWKTAMKMYDQVLKMNPEQTDAQHNRELVKKMVQALEEQMEKQKGDDGEDSENSDEDKKEDEENEDKKQENQGDQGDQSEQQQEQQQDQQNSDQNQEGSEDQQKQDQQQDGKDGEKKDRENPEEKDGEEQKPEPQPSPEEKDSESEEKPQPKPGEGKGDDEKQQEQMVMQKTLTLEQAKQLLDAQRSRELPLIFRPPPNKDQKGGRGPIVKTW